MQLLAGTSGFAYKEWKGVFYPADIKAADMLKYYAGKFPAVEINNTFYRMPTESVVAGWADQVPAGFTFVLKAPQKITHFKRLKEVEPELDYFCTVAKALGTHIGPVLVQLPPNFKRDDERLASFLAAAPDDLRIAFEFRNPSWLDEEVYAVLRAHDAALVIAHDEEAETPMVATASWGYARLRKVNYEPGELAAWAEKLRTQPWKQLFAFFKHENEGTGPALAAEFTALFEG
ncbi:MAG: DUF72 domain-containing protein [Longimicrobiales bacterium]